MIPSHITFQATQAMSVCSELYSVVQEPAIRWLPKGMVDQTKVVNLLEWYAENQPRMQNYDRVAKNIFKAIGLGKSIGYVTYGNPMAYDRVAYNLIQLVKDSGFSLEVIPGISSLDCILCDLRVDMAPGIQVFDASWLFACRIRPRIDVPLLLMQVGAFGSLQTHYTERQDGRSLNHLVHYCLEFYSPSHPVSLIRSRSNQAEPSHIRHLALRDLGKVTAEDLSGASLYLPSSQDIVPVPEIIERMENT
jgi:precorrin-4 methylase